MRRHLVHGKALLIEIGQGRLLNIRTSQEILQGHIMRPMGIQNANNSVNEEHHFHVSPSGICAILCGFPLHQQCPINSLQRSICIKKQIDETKVEGSETRNM